MKEQTDAVTKAIECLEHCWWTEAETPPKMRKQSLINHIERTLIALGVAKENLPNAAYGGMPKHQSGTTNSQTKTPTADSSQSADSVLRKFWRWLWCQQCSKCNKDQFRVAFGICADCWHEIRQRHHHERARDQHDKLVQAIKRATQDSSRSSSLVYVVIEQEAMEDGQNQQSIVGAWFNKIHAEEYATNQDGGRYMSWRVQKVEVQDAITA